MSMMETVPNAGMPAAAQRRKAADMSPTDWRGLVGGLLKFFSEEAKEPEHAAADAEPRTLYVKRPLKNAAELIEWAHAAGIKKTLPADEMHVTLAFSKEPVMWPEPQTDDTIPDAEGLRTVEPLGDKGAVVLRFEAPQFQKRWSDLRDAGAVWDYPTFKPHVTITYDAGDVDLESIQPFMGELEFGPEVFAEIDPDWADKARSSLVGDKMVVAAGVRAQTPDGMVLFLKRSDHGDHKGKWCFPGGMVEADETPAIAAIREFREETGYVPEDGIGPDDLKELNETKGDNGIKFTTFMYAVGSPFIPTLNEEHDAWAWAPPSQPPQPLHPGVADFLNREMSMAADSALKLALDRASVRSTDKDGRLHVAETNICKACVSPYRGKEIPGYRELGLDPDRMYNLLRPPEELERAANTSNGVQLLRKHTPVNADDHKPYDVVGALGTTARWEHPFVKNGLTIWPAKDIEGVETKEKTELSPGYHYKPVMESGIYTDEDGKNHPYDGKMLDIVFNHVAIVEDGRQGPEVIVGDSAEELFWGLIGDAISEFVGGSSRHV